MIAVGFGVMWGGYSVALWGWCLLRGYDITLGQLVNPLQRYKGPWPPPQMPDSQVFPGGGQAVQPATTPVQGPATADPELNLPSPPAPVQAV